MIEESSILRGATVLHNIKVEKQPLHYLSFVLFRVAINKLTIRTGRQSTNTFERNLKKEDKFGN